MVVLEKSSRIVIPTLAWFSARNYRHYMKQGELRFTAFDIAEQRSDLVRRFTADVPQ
jgi:hypothetical protein